jgi:hypothetical protein
MERCTDSAKRGKWGINSARAKIYSCASIVTVANPILSLVSRNNTNGSGDADVGRDKSLDIVRNVDAGPLVTVAVDTYTSSVIKACIDSRVDPVQPAMSMSGSNVKPHSLSIACKYKEQKKKCFHSGTLSYNASARY